MSLTRSRESELTLKIGTMLPSMGSTALSVAMADVYGQMNADSLWVADHLLGFTHPDLWRDFPASQVMPDPDAFLDPFCVAAAVGMGTPRSLGTAVTDGTRRRGGDLARTALTLNESCGGGFILGIGAGEKESNIPFGYDFARPTGNLVRTVAEIRSLFDTGQMPDGGVGRTGIDRTSTHGLPQLWVAANGGPRGLRLAGENGDGWMSSSLDPAKFAESLSVVRTIAKQAGRPMPTPAICQVIMLGESQDAISALMDEIPVIKLFTLFADGEFWSRYDLTHPNGLNAKGPHVIPHELDPQELRVIASKIPNEMFAEYVWTGNAAEVAARVKPLADAGAEHLIVIDMSGATYGPAEAAGALSQLSALIDEVHRW